MLLKTIARKTLELKNHRIDKIVQSDKGEIIIHLQAKKRRRLESSCCHKKARVIDHLPERTWSHVLWYSYQHG